MTCIPRNDMPQVDIRDMHALLGFLARQGIGHIECHIPTEELHMRQCPDHFNGVHGTELEAKPLLVSHDFYILDGNHRWCGAKAEGRSECHCYRLSADFDTAVQAILHFSKTYRYGDGAVHPMGVW